MHGQRTPLDRFLRGADNKWSAYNLHETINKTAAALCEEGEDMIAVALAMRPPRYRPQPVSQPTNANDGDRPVARTPSQSATTS